LSSATGLAWKALHVAVKPTVVSADILAFQENWKRIFVEQKLG
jgi:hypothetical protein